VSAGQYDFQTLAAHELAHTVGLGESIDPNSVMYEYLPTGTARRSFTSGNLTLINTDADRYMKVAAFNPQTVSALVAPVARPGVMPLLAPAPIGFAMPPAITVMSPLCGTADYLRPSHMPLGFWEAISQSKSVAAAEPVWYRAFSARDLEDSGSLQAAPRRWEEAIERVFEALYQETDRPAQPEPAPEALPAIFPDQDLSLMPDEPNDFTAM
jgi:hypothetical protein